jgi:hypothetical protein
MRDNWLIEAQAAESLLPLLQSWLDQAQLHRDEDTGAEEAKELDLLAGCFAASLSSSDTTMYKSFDEAPQGSTAILDITGPILKDDFCDYGMNTKAEQIRAAYQHANINSLLIKFDTPGGQANAPALAADAIREARAAGVPVLGWVDHGQAASAGMWIFAACTEGWLSQATDAVGSIGGYQRIRKNTSLTAMPPRAIPRYWRPSWPKPWTCSSRASRPTAATTSKRAPRPSRAACSWARRP